MNKSTDLANSFIYSIKKLLYLFTVSITLLMLISCQDNSTGPGDSQQITEEEAVAAMAEAMRNRGFNAPSSIATSAAKNVSAAEFDLTLRDYITTELNDNGDRQVMLWIGPDGNIIPNGDWRDANPNACEDQNRYLKGAIKALNFKMNRVADGYFVFIQYIDVETGEIEEQRDSDAVELAVAIEKAWNKLKTPIGKLTDPCGRRKGFTFVLQSETVFESTDSDGVDMRRSDDVRAEFDITYNEQESIHEGKGKLEWLEFDIASDKGSFECDLPAEADLAVHSFTNKNDTTASETKASIQFLNWNKTSCDVTTPNGTATLEFTPGFTILWQYLHLEEITEKIIRDPNNVLITNESKYEITGWETPENDDIVARKVYDRTETPGQGTTLSEKTTIEIRKK